MWLTVSWVGVCYFDVKCLFGFCIVVDLCVGLCVLYSWGGYVVLVLVLGCLVVAC